MRTTFDAVFQTVVKILIKYDTTSVDKATYYLLGCNDHCCNN